MMQTRPEEIKAAFARNGILLKEELNTFKPHNMSESVTNQFMKVEDIHVFAQYRSP